VPSQESGDIRCLLNPDFKHIDGKPLQGLIVYGYAQTGAQERLTASFITET
jgi:hypothetical protein